MNIEALVREISQQIPLDSWTLSLPPLASSPGPEFFCHCTEFQSENTCDCTQRHETAVAGLKRDLNLAAKAGQTLLSQVHAMETQLARQETEFKTRQQELVTQNQEILRRNADLIDTTRDSAQSLADSEARIAQLTAQLAEANARCLRLNSYMSLAQSLEHQVKMLESMQEGLQGELSVAKQDRSLAESRWRAAEQLVTQVSRQYKQLSLDVTAQSLPPVFNLDSTVELDDEPANWGANRTIDPPSLDDIDDTVDSSFDIDTEFYSQRLSTPLRPQKSVPATLSKTPRPPYHIPSFKSLDELKAAAAAAAAAEFAARTSKTLQPQRSMQHLEPVPARVSTAMSKETLHSLRPTLRRNMSHESVLSMVVEPLPLEKPEISTVAEPARVAVSESQAHATSAGVRTDAREQLRGLRTLQNAQPAREPRRETTRWMFVPFRR